MKTNQEIETELRGVYRNAKWNKHFTKTASKIIEDIRKENGFAEFTTKERVAILESIAQALMNFNVQHMANIKKLKREFIFVYIALLMLTSCIFILTLKVYS